MSEPQAAHPMTPHPAAEIAAAGWPNAVRFDRPDRDIAILCLDATPEKDIRLDVEGPATFCIAVFLDGSGSVAIDGGVPLDVTPGTAIVFFSRGHTRGTNQVNGGQRVRCVDIRFDLDFLARYGGPGVGRLRNGLLVDCSVPAKDALLIGFAAPPALLDCARDIAGSRFHKPEVRDLYLRAKAMEALALTFATVEDTASAARITGNRVGARLVQARRLIEAHFDRPWTIERLAKAVGLNERELKSGFRVMVGRSIHAHLRDVRIEAAAAMLREGRSVTDAALAAGFGNLSHFSKTFREAKGVVPRDYARRGGAAGPTTEGDVL
jgi:AraC-like DNA-binding protein